VKRKPSSAGRMESAALLSYRFASSADKAFYIVNTCLLVLVMLLIVYPMWYCVCCSFSSSTAVITNRVTLWPVGFNLKAYKVIFESSQIINGLFNTIIYASVGSAWAILLTFLAAYPLSRKDLPGRRWFTIYFAVTMFFSGGIIPNYLLLRSMNMLNTRWAIIVPFILSTYNVIIVRSYFQSNIADELLEVSHIDGCSDVRFFATIAMPLSKPVLAVMVLYHVVWRWNTYFSAMMYLSDTSMHPLQMVLRDLLFLLEMSAEQLSSLEADAVRDKYNLMQLVRYSALVVGAFPMMLMYPFIQKSFVKGIMIGSIKG
jgi:putative aldouronate transport system permease protein